MKKILSRDSLKIDEIPESYIIEELERLREEGKKSSLPLLMPASSTQVELPYWPKTEQKSRDQVIIIDF